MIKEFTCVVCPNGCRITAEWNSENEEYKITGNACSRGLTYVRQELTGPVRTFATSVGVTGGVLPLASVRVTAPIPLSRVKEAVELIHAQTLTAPVHAGDVLLHDFMGLACDVIVTKTVEACPEEAAR